LRRALTILLPGQARDERAGIPSDSAVLANFQVFEPSSR